MSKKRGKKIRKEKRDKKKTEKYTIKSEKEGQRTMIETDQKFAKKKRQQHGEMYKSVPLIQKKTKRKQIYIDDEKRRQQKAIKRAKKGNNFAKKTRQESHKKWEKD